MDPLKDSLNLPPLGTVPTDQHVQVVWMLSEMNTKLEILAEGKRVQNGRVDKLEGRMAENDTWRATQKGEGKGKEGVWKLLYIISGLVIGALTVYIALKH